MFEKEVYEAPTIEITEFEINSSIATSADGNLFGNEEIWGS